MPNKNKIVLKLIRKALHFNMPIICVPNHKAFEKMPVEEFGVGIGDKEKSLIVLECVLDEAHRNGIKLGLVVRAKLYSTINQLRMQVYQNLNNSSGHLLINCLNNNLKPVISICECRKFNNYLLSKYNYSRNKIAISRKENLKAKICGWENVLCRLKDHRNYSE